jgi:hypothetical protein
MTSPSPWELTTRSRLDEGLGAVRLALAGAGALAGVFCAATDRNAPMVAAFAAALVLVSLPTRKRHARGPVRIDERGVDLGGRLVPREAIGSAYFVPGNGARAPFVRLVGPRLGELARVEVDGPETGARALAALGLPADGGEAAFRAFEPHLGSWFVGFAVIFALLAVGALFTLDNLWSACWLAFLAFGAARKARVPALLRVASDGVALDGRDGTTFVPIAQLEGVEGSSRGLVLRTTSGERAVPLTSGLQLGRDGFVQRDAAVHRLREAIARRRDAPEPPLTAQIARRGRPVTEWVRDLPDAREGFRDGAVPDDALLEVLESPTTDETGRAAAALLLSRRGAPEARRRIGVAAGACASPRLRVVLEKAAEGEEAAVVEAMAVLEDAGPPRAGGATR